MKQSKNTQKQKPFQEVQTSFSEYIKYRIVLDTQPTPWEKRLWVSQNHTISYVKKKVCPKIVWMQYWFYQQTIQLRAPKKKKKKKYVFQKNK